MKISLEKYEDLLTSKWRRDKDVAIARDEAMNVDEVEEMNAPFVVDIDIPAVPALNDNFAGAEMTQVEDAMLVDTITFFTERREDAHPLFVELIWVTY